MTKEEVLQFTGTVMEALPNATFRVQLENGHEIIAHTSGKMRKFRIRVMVGDKVDIEMTPLMWVGVGVTGAAVILGVILGIAHKRKKHRKSRK